ncbi:NERD domain-containing protein [Aquibacillus salsiterrae]|uniref:NERD domain-containing protein n=1 Tax=Aquibacillus salsiterrae TaxID=2950439 RepID=A0A9X4AEM0_9BACI|nr:NERD domain-containing protein [Aquibacillus salsiterrae]MDC3416739.1 NERD domain-containing protein [Aquibacillus salsiterrae]
MLLKARTIPLELILLESLNTRMSLSEKDASTFFNQKKGYKGECRFDQLFEPLVNKYHIINDLLLDVNNSLVQIDSLFIASDTIHLFEIKNFEGDFIYENNRWLTGNRTEISNPLLQINRSESLFRRLLHDLGFSFAINYHLIFVNPEFLLYHAPQHAAIIFPAQINRVLDRMSVQTGKLSDKLAKQLVSLHVNENPYRRLPKYSFDELAKGLCCMNCGSIVTSLKHRNILCNSCNIEESVDHTILRTINEFSTLFPNEKITTRAINAWCDNQVSIKTIQRVLAKNYTYIGHGKSSNYVIK